MRPATIRAAVPPQASASARMPTLAALARSLADPAGPAALLLAALLALALACWLFSPGFLRGHAAFWQQQDGDIAQYLAGYNAFVREPWQWPLLRLSSINYPQGTLATFLDTVPLYALLLKLLQHGPDTPFRNPYPTWIALCYLLQGVGAWWLCREARLKSWVALLALTLLLAAYPALSFRIHHVSLMSQWLLLFGLAAYLRGTRLERLATPAWLLLVPLAFYINIYLCCMLSLLFVADLARQLQYGRWRQALAAALGAYGILGLSLFVTMLPLGPQAGGGDWGFGFYSMNVLGPLTGGRLLQFNHALAHEGQGEGYAYLGIFLLGAALYALHLRRRHDPTFWQRHRAMALMLACMTLYALSNIVHLGPVELFHVDLPEWSLQFTGLMRASGRFFWPVGYALTAFTVITIARHAGPRRAAVLLLGLLYLHDYDLQPHFERSRASVALPAPARIDTAVWEPFLGADSRTLQVYPPFGCSKVAGPAGMLPTMLYAVRHQLNISTGYLARVKKPCDNYAQEIAATTSPATAFVFMRTDFAALDDVEKLLGGKPAARCIEADFAWLCRRQLPTLENKQ